MEKCNGSSTLASKSSKTEISLKRVKTDEKLLWRAYRNSPVLFRTVPSPTVYGLPFSKIVGSQHQPKTAIVIISRTGKATDYKFAPYIHRVHPNKSPWKIWEKRDWAWAYPGTAEIFWVPPIIDFLSTSSSTPVWTGLNGEITEQSWKCSLFFIYNFFSEQQQALHWELIR